MTDPKPGGFDERQAITKIQRELRLVDDAISLVAGGRYPSVTVAGIRFGDQILAESQRVAVAKGVCVRQLFPADESGADLIVERLNAPEEA